MSRPVLLDDVRSNPGNVTGSGLLATGQSLSSLGGIYLGHSLGGHAAVAAAAELVLPPSPPPPHVLQVNVPRKYPQKENSKRIS